MSRASFLKHKETEILHLDFRKLTAREAPLVLEEVRTLVSLQPEHSVLVLCDLTSTEIDPDLVKALKELAEHDAPYVKASALLGITGLKRVLLNSVVSLTGRKLLSFDTEAEALDWLLSQ